MGNYHFLLFPLMTGTFCPSSCCSLHDSGPLSQDQSVGQKAYVSRKMQLIINSLDTCCTSLVPLENIIPACNRFIHNIEERFFSNTLGNCVQLEQGYTDFETLYSQRPITIVPAMAQSIGIQPGVYYITCRAVNYTIKKEVPISLITPYSSDIMGINPETLTEKGYAYTMVMDSDGKYVYEFTTYIWALSTGQCGDKEWIYQDPEASDALPVKFIEAEDYMRNLQWRYIC